MADNRAQAEALRNQRGDLQGRLLSTAATVGSVALPVKLAISAEDTFADLRKVMEAPEEVMQQVFADAQEMSTRTGKSFEDVISIMTSAAQAGLGKTREQLLGVADQAVKMSIAWGVSVDQAGKSMAQWRSSMEMNDYQAKHTADVINALSNTMAAEAGEIDQIFTRMGPMMASAGMATQDIAALATAFKAAGAQVEVAGTAMKNFKNVMTAGSSGLTDAKIGILKFLKIDPDELQKQFYDDSKAAIMRVLEALKDVRPEEKDSIASGLFGQESIAAISPLLKNIGLVEQAFQIANSDVNGSVNEEYANRMKTTATALSQMAQSFRNLGISAGKTLLPPIGLAARGISKVAEVLSGLVDRFPRLASVVMIAGAAVASLAVGSLFLGLMINTVKTAANSVSGVFLRMAASQAAATTTTTAFGVAATGAGAGARVFAGGLRRILMATGVGAVLVGIGYAVQLLIDHWEEVVATMDKAWAWVTDTWSRLCVFFTELGNNLGEIFDGWGEKITFPFVVAWNTAIGIWHNAGEIFSGIWSGISDSATGFWQEIVEWAAWAEDGVMGIWNVVTESFGTIIDGISAKFQEFFAWLKERFAWVFQVIDTVSGFLSRVGNAVGNAWNKAFGDDEKAASKEGAKAGEAAARAQAKAEAREEVKAPQKRRPSFSAFKRQMEDGKKGGRSGGKGSRKSSASERKAKDKGPVTVVTLSGDNSQIQTLFIPASVGSSSSAAAIANGASASLPAVQAARVPAKARALPKTPERIGSGLAKSRQSLSNAVSVELTQNFDIMSENPAAFRKVMETLRPDFEALVKKALARLASDKRRTAFSL